MRVVTRWPALVPAIERAGHEAVVVDPVEDEKWVKVYINGTFNLPEERDYCTARPRGARR
jgi:hypothetical protein